jgi:hypothetical protein
MSHFIYGMTSFAVLWLRIVSALSILRCQGLTKRF